MSPLLTVFMQLVKTTNLSLLSAHCHCEFQDEHCTVCVNSHDVGLAADRSWVQLSTVSLQLTTLSKLFMPA